MKNKDIIQIPNNIKVPGLKIRCGTCGGTWVGNTCLKNGKHISSCPNQSKLKFISVIEKNGKRKVLTLPTRDITTAIEMHAQHRRKVKEGIQTEEKYQTPVIEKHSNSPLLADMLAYHVSHMRGENTPAHQRRVRSSKHCKQVQKTYLDFISSLKHDYNVKELTINQVDQEMVGKFYAHVISRHPAPRTYNMAMTAMRTFFNFLIRQGKTTANPFLTVIRKPETHDKTTLEKKEFEALIRAIKPETGKREVGDEVKSFYRPWVKDGIQMGLMSGRRTEEILQMRWKDIALDNQEKMFAINVTDFKVSRQQNRLADNPKKISVPITQELEAFLLENGYEKFKGSEKYIIGNEEEMSRDTMRKFISKSFTHYWEQTDFSKSKHASFKTLRKTYLSSLAAAIGIGNAQVISQHSDTRVLSEHYVSDKVIGLTAKNFSVFPSEEDVRQKELHELRKSTNGISLEK